MNKTDFIKSSTALYKIAGIEQLRDLIREDNDPGMISEFLQLPHARRTAGRASATQEMLGETADMNLAYPRFNRILTSIIPTIAGGMIGNKLTGENSGNRTRNVALGSGAGLAVGAFIDSMMRRKSRKDVRATLDETIGSGVKTSELGDIGYGTPLGGVHQQGRADALEAKMTGRTRQTGNPVLTGLEIGARVPGVNMIAAPSALVGDLVEGARAQDRIRRTRPQIVVNASNQ